MRNIILIAGVAAGIIYYVYEWWNHREHQQESAHGGGIRGRSCENDDDDEEFVIVPPNSQQRKLKQAKPPGQNELCSICLDHFYRKDTKKGYTIIALPDCGHWFHQKCAIRLLEYHPCCPMCRLPIDNSVLRGTPVRVGGELGQQQHLLAPATQQNTSDIQEREDLAQPSCSYGSRLTRKNL